MWKLLLKGVLAVSANPTVRAWAKRKAAALAAKIRHKADAKIADLTKIVVPPPSPALPDDVVHGIPRLGRVPLPPPAAVVVSLIRATSDIYTPGTVIELDGHKLRVGRLLSYRPGEALYEAAEVL